MEITFLDVFDLFRFMAGTITCELIFVEGSVEKREHFGRRVSTVSLLLLVWTAGYFPVLYFTTVLSDSLILFRLIFLALWWIGSDFVTIFFLWYVYEISVSNAFFRGMMGIAVQQIVTVTLQYILIKMWLPGFDEQHPFLYVLIVILVYLVMELVCRQFLAGKMQDSGHVVVTNSPENVMRCSLTLILLSLCTGLSSSIVEYSISYAGESSGVARYLLGFVVPWFCIFILLVICVIILLNQYTTFRMLQQKQENELLQQLEQEKAQQYAFTKENIDLINHKCHDLKYRIQALKLAEGSEKEHMIEDVSRDIRFYDASIQTENPTLDTILTEKSLICTGAGIRFSCNIQDARLDRIEVVDLYTMLGNALDNAIECVRQYEDPGKKTISLTIREKGSMVHIFVDNYFEGHLEIRGGFPVTGKGDRRYHGFGVKSINLLAKKYDGDSMVSVQNHTFSIHILIPS